MNHHKTSEYLPLYIERGGEQSLIPPGTLNSTQFYIFLVKGDKTRLQVMADRLFNQPSGGAVEYRPLSDYSILMFTHVSQLTSPQARPGWIDYHDIALWVPMLAIEKKMGIDVAQRLVMYPPYIMVDNGATMVTGREVFGLPKEMGTFTMPHHPDYASDFTADVMGYSPTSLSRQSIASRLWSVHRQSSVLPVSYRPLQRFQDALSTLREVMSPFERKAPAPVVPNITSFIKQMITGIPALGLKQFRDATQIHRASYQAIVEAPLKLLRFHDARLYSDPFTFVLNDLASHPVAEDTGLIVGSQPVALSLYLRLDMQMGPGVTLWQSTSSSTQN